MSNLPDTRRKLRTAIAVLVAVNLLAIAALVYMLVRGTSALPSEFQSLHEQVQQRKAITVPPEVVDKRIAEAREQIAHFYENRFPNNSSDIFETLGRVAKDNRVRLNQASYKVNDQVELPAVHLIEIGATLNGSYADAMKFINALEREKMFFVIDNVGLREQQAGGQQGGGGAVQLNIQIETYLRGEA